MFHNRLKQMIFKQPEEEKVSYSKSLLWSEEAWGHGVMLIELQQHIFQPIPHSQRELDQLSVHAGRYH